MRATSVLHWTANLNDLGAVYRIEIAAWKTQEILDLLEQLYRRKIKKAKNICRIMGSQNS
jgi:hypothetical protein